MKINKFIAIAILLPVLCLGLIMSAQAQMTPVQQGYYNQGYQDGVTDAQNNLSNDYTRYRNKYTKKFEAYYKQGYEYGYTSIRPNTTRWGTNERNSYDQGYKFGLSDRQKNISRLPERYDGRYDKNYESYFRKGYYDAYDGLNRQYDTTIDGNTFPTTNPNNNQTGRLVWKGKVDDRATVTVTGISVQSQDVSGSGLEDVKYNMSAELPRRNIDVAVRKTDGRGDVQIIQQPRRENNYTLIFQIVDTKKGRDKYEIEATWDATRFVEEPYQPGRIIWKGKVDNRVDLHISGSDLRINLVAGRPTTDVSQSGSFYLPRRNGTFVSARKREGRGSVTVSQQPSQENDFTAIIQIYDPEGSDDKYEIEISW
jgi:hypothetical protein